MTDTNAQSGNASPGSTVQLVWPASTDYQFTFVLSYGANGNFVAVTCSIRSNQASFSGNPYALPLQLAQKDNAGRAVSIQMQTMAGSGGYAGAVWCKINVPGFIFEGAAFEFSAQVSGPPPLTVW